MNKFAVVLPYFGKFKPSIILYLERFFWKADRIRKGLRSGQGSGQRQDAAGNMMI